ncbi:MAG: hypothetical protein CL678_03735 [Bdellovibrionaceae bacterium]|nr:hypothetical protein [Pseudobdellovibrionaceae bacterium]|tara:strand:+ start:731 stop:991 length:261 start_codon:yes stop_codon:yes gene_type:complete
MSKNHEDIPFYIVLKALEQERKWKEKDVLARVDVPRSTYRAWREGESEPSKRIYWRRLSLGFGEPLEELLWGEVIQYKSPRPWFLD